jgi:biopolymer transport protein ExbD
MRQRRKADSPEIQIAPMIDCVFLMLVYFMTTSSLEKSEADLPCPAGEAGVMTDPLPAVDEQTLAISNNGEVDWNGSFFDLFSIEDPDRLVSRLLAFKETCDSANSEPVLRIDPSSETPHQAIVTLLDCITGTGIDSIHFP